MLAAIDHARSSSMPPDLLASDELSSDPADAFNAFTGREWDPETGLYYYRARYYDPKLGRFISEDPIDPMAFAYAANQPTNLIDPFGLMEVRNLIDEQTVDQSQIPGNAVARTTVGAAFTCYCECEGSRWRLKSILFLGGKMLLPKKVTRVPAVDKSVTDTASARAHEYGWHIDVGVSAVRAIVEPEEAKPFGSKDLCDASCSNLKKRVPDLFRKTVRRTQEAEEARARGGR